ncbi:MAG: NfeD family protein [Treponema sp.]
MNMIVSFFLSYMPWFWLAAAVLFAVIEAATLGLTTIWCAVSAVVMIFVSLTPLPLKWQFVVFALLSLLLIFFTRPFAVKRLHIKKETTNADSLIGKKVQIIKPITEFEKGQAKVNGAVWTAAAADQGDIPAGSECTVEKIEGVTLIVKKV